MLLGANHTAAAAATLARAVSPRVLAAATTAICGVTAGRAFAALSSAPPRRSLMTRSSSSSSSLSSSSSSSLSSSSLSSSSGATTTSLLCRHRSANLHQRRTIVRVVQAYERGVRLRLGKLSNADLRPGLRLCIPVLDEIKTIDMRDIVSDLGAQDVITKDNVSIVVDGVIQYCVVDPEQAILNVYDLQSAVMDIAQLKIREVLSHSTVNEVLHNREQLNAELIADTSKQMERWGVALDFIRIKDIVFDQKMTRAMALKAEAERTAEAKLINAQVDVDTARKYAEAADALSSNAAAMRLRELEAFSRIAREKSNAIFVMPTECLNSGVTLPSMALTPTSASPDSHDDADQVATNDNGGHHRLERASPGTNLHK